MAEPALKVETYKPTPKQDAFHASTARFRLLLGAWGAGKTYSLVWEDIALALEYPGSFGVVYRKTYPALRDTTKKDYLDVCPPELIAKVVQSEGREAIEFVNGSQTIFRCLDDFRKLGSTQFDRISIDEGWEITQEEFRTLAFGRLRGKLGPRRLMISTNPPNRDTWLFDFFVTNAEKNDVGVFHLTTYDNKEHLPDGYIANLERMPELWRRKFLFGEWGVLVTGTPVFSNWRRDLHVVHDASPKPGIPLLRGWDFGFHHPACSVWQVMPSGHALCLWEKLGRDQDLPSFLTEVLEEHERLFPGYSFEDYCDAAGAQANAQGLTALKQPGAGKSGKDLIPSAVAVMRNAPFFLKPRWRRIGMHASVTRLQHMLGTLIAGRPLLQISDACPIHLDAYGGGYVIDTDQIEKRSQSGHATSSHEQIPKKDGFYDHLVDTDRFILGWARVQEVNPFQGRPLPRTWRAIG